MKRYRATFFAMACDNTIEVFASDDAIAEQALHAAQSEVLRIEAKYSRYREDSVVSEINRGAGQRETLIDAETAQLLAIADAAYQQSDGLFDITSGVLRRVWNFKSGVVPTREQISSVLPLVAWRDVQLAADRVRLPHVGMEIDFGGFGKEYAADRAAAILLRHGIAHGFVELAGDVVVTGPQGDATPWALGIRHPREEGVIATLPIASGAVATSGDYERFMLVDGVRHCHLLDPRTGRSVQGPQSVTAFASTCLVAGLIATIAMLNGSSARRWLEESGARAFVVEQEGGQGYLIGAD